MEVRPIRFIDHIVLFCAWCVAVSLIFLFPKQHITDIVKATPKDIDKFYEQHIFNEFTQTEHDLNSQMNSNNTIDLKNITNNHYITPNDITSEFTEFITSKSIVLTGMVRDGERHLLGLLLQIEKLSCHFNHFEIIIMENGSRDRTLTLLNVWSKRPIHCSLELKESVNTNLKIRNTHKHIIHYDHLNDPAPKGMNRMDRFVYYRNIQLDYIRNLIDTQKIVKPDYLMIIDYDIQGIDQAKLFEEFIISSQFHQQNVFCVNGMEYTGRYRDSFATVFKDDNHWCHDDRDVCHIQLQLNRFTEMRSCFGGLAIYSYDDIFQSNCRYETRANLESKAKKTYQWFQKQKQQWRDFGICEHIQFHDCLNDNNENFKVIFSRDSYLFYGWTQYWGWEKELDVYSESHW